MAPFNVELASDMVVQPDILVVLNKNLDRVLDSHIIGAPVFSLLKSLLPALQPVTVVKNMMLTPTRVFPNTGLPTP